MMDFDTCIEPSGDTGRLPRFVRVERIATSPKTVGELEPGDVIYDGGIWRVKGRDGLMTELTTGSISIWDIDTPISGDVWRVET